LHPRRFGRIDFAAAPAILSTQLIGKGAFDKTAGISVFTPSSSGRQFQDFVRAYGEEYGVMPTQRSTFAFEATRLGVDAIGRAGSDVGNPACSQGFVDAALFRRLQDG